MIFLNINNIIMSKKLKLNNNIINKEEDQNKIYYAVNSNSDYYVNKYKKEQNQQLNKLKKSFLINNVIYI